MKVRLIRLIFECLFRFRPTRAAIYSHQPFPRWPYLFSPCQLQTLSNLLLSVDAPGSVVEVGCNQGWLSVFLLEVMKESGVSRGYVGIDTFDGFLPQDVEAEYGRCKARGVYAHQFSMSKQQWYDHSLTRAGYSVRSYRADATTFDYGSVGPIAFALIDVDLYRSVLLALRSAWEHVSPAGIVVVDDCDPTHKLWDGAHQAYQEFCAELGIPPEIVSGKLGILRKHSGSKNLRLVVK